MPRVQLSVPWATPTRNHPAGAVVDVTEAEAAQHIEGRSAKPYEGESQRPSLESFKDVFFAWLKRHAPEQVSAFTPEASAAESAFIDELPAKPLPASA